MWHFQEVANIAGCAETGSCGGLVTSSLPHLIQASTTFTQVLYKAKSLGLRLILCLTNNWQDFGGMDQYISW